MNILAKIQRRGFVSGLFSGIAAAAFANVARAQTPDPTPRQLGPVAARERTAGVDGYGSDRARCRL